MSENTHHIIDCADCYFHGVLSPAEKQYFEEHCTQCRICKVALEEAEKRAATLRALPTREPSPEFIQSTLTKIDTYEKTHGRRFRILRRAVAIGLAASILILGALHLYVANLSASPYDLRIFGQSKLFAGSDASLRVQLLDHSRNLALHNVPVLIELLGRGRQLQLAAFSTNEQGTFPARFRLPDWDDGDYELRVTARPHGETHVISRTVKLQRSWKVMLSSDRPVYQPGQTIHVRSLALRGMDLKPVAGRDAVFSISDPKGNVIFKAKDVTSKFGIASADCPIASEIIEGAYTIHCQLDDTSSRLAVEVKKYVLPKFKIDLATEQPFYQPGQRIRGTVHAAYFFGKPVADGSVELSLQSREEKPLVRHQLTLKTDEKGNAKFEFPPLPEKLIGDSPLSRYSGRGAGGEGLERPPTVPSPPTPLPEYRERGEEVRLDLEATITDSAGQKQSRKLSPFVSAQPLRIEVIPEAGTLVQGVPNTIYLFVTSADGQPVKSCVAVSGIDKELTTSELGVAAFEITPAAGEITRTIRATDEQGRSARREATLRVGEANGDFLVRSDRAVYNGGDTMHLTALGGGSEPVFLDFIKDGQTILTETIAMKEGRGQLDFDLPPELFGTLQMCAYRFGAHGLPLRKTRVLYVHPPGEVKIETVLDKQEYRPGESARIAFRLTDKNGKPAPGAISLAAVDEAVFSVLGERAGMEQHFFTLHQGLLRPVHAISAWSPQTVQAKRSQFESAVFANALEIESPPDVADVRGANLTISRLRSGIHPVVGSSFDANDEDTRKYQIAALHSMITAWTVAALLTGLLLYVLMWIFLSRRLIVGVHVLLCFLVCGGLSLLQQRGGDFQSHIEGFPFDNGFVLRRSYFGRIGLGTGTMAPPSMLYLLHGTTDHGMNFPVAPPRLREYFPETLLWRPELITDDQGRANLAIDLADSITTWRLTSSAVTANGKLGALQTDIKVFQPFFVDINLPVALTRGDEVSVPIVLYNYLDEPQQVTLKLDGAAWFTSADQAERTFALQPREVRSLGYRIRVTKVGQHDLQVTAMGCGVADAVKRRIEVVPDGRRVERVWNGQISNLPHDNVGQIANLPFDVPDNAIDGSARLLVKIYPSSFSQLVEGLDAIFQLPYGCFEQTSSTTYPNVLALDYLKRTGKSVPAVEAKARQYIHLGYQRLLGFEVAGGGFDWFGRPPANRTLTAYGVMEFTDMARVHDVDPNLIERTRKWLLAQRHADGSWEPEGHVPHGLPAARLSATAYIAWAVFGGPHAANEAAATRSFLLTHPPQAIADPHTLALMCNALLATGADAAPYLDRLDALKQTSANRQLAWWQQSGRTTFYGAGQSGSIETTALAALAFLHAKHNPATANAALAWIIQQRNARGAWHSTQATVLALKALLAGTDHLAGAGERRINLVLGDVKKAINIPADQAEVMKLIDLSEHLKPGSQSLTLTEATQSGTSYQVALRYHVPGEADKKDEPLSLQITYDRQELQVGARLETTTVATNNMTEAAAMVLLDLPIPAGFALETAAFEKMIAEQRIAKYEVQPRSVLVYLRELPAQGRLELRYAFRATMPVRVTVPAGRVYEYYNPAREGRSVAIELRVS